MCFVVENKALKEPEELRVGAMLSISQSETFQPYTMYNMDPGYKFPFVGWRSWENYVASLWDTSSNKNVYLKKNCRK